MGPSLVRPRGNPRRPAAGRSDYCERGIRAHLLTARRRRFAGAPTRNVIVMELGEVRETRMWQAVRRHPQLCDAALAVALVVPAIIAIRVGGRHGEQPRMLEAFDLVALVAAFGA